MFVECRLLTDTARTTDPIRKCQTEDRPQELLHGCFGVELECGWAEKSKAMNAEGLEPEEYAPEMTDEEMEEILRQREAFEEIRTLTK